MDANSKLIISVGTLPDLVSLREAGSKESWLSGGQRLQRGRGARKDLLW
jgi:hypothetical protein